MLQGDRIRKCDLAASDGRCYEMTSLKAERKADLMLFLVTAAACESFETNEHSLIYLRISFLRRLKKARQGCGQSSIRRPLMTPTYFFLF